MLSRVENGLINHEAGSRLAWGNDFSDNTNDQNGQSSKERVRVIGAENLLVKSHLAQSQNVSNGFQLTLVGFFFVFAFPVHLMFGLIVPLTSRSRCSRQISTAVRFSAESCPSNYTQHERSTARFCERRKFNPSEWELIANRTEEYPGISGVQFHMKGATRGHSPWPPEGMTAAEVLAIPGATGAPLRRLRRICRIWSRCCRRTLER